jgi:hypothetical protein
MGFMVGKSCAKPSLKMHAHVVAWNEVVVSRCENLCFSFVNRARTMSKLFIYCNYSILFNDLLYW